MKAFTFRFMNRGKEVKVVKVKEDDYLEAYTKASLQIIEAGIEYDDVQDDMPVVSIPNARFGNL